MPPVNWTIFEGLPGATTDNFEYLCRGLIRWHYGCFGTFQGLANQPGVEFHLKILSDCSLGKSGRWYGWQCKWYDLPSGRAIGTTRRKKIVDGIRKTEKILPDVTDWVLWTRHNLTKKDQEWFSNIKTKMELHLWTKHDVETHLSGSAEILRGTYFGELVLTPDDLTKIRAVAIEPIRQRWVSEVHQVMHAEDKIRLFLGEITAWEELTTISQQLNIANESIVASSAYISKSLKGSIESLRLAAVDCSQQLMSLYESLKVGDYGATFQHMNQGPPFNPEWNNTLRKLRNQNSKIALYLTNILSLITKFRNILQSLANNIQIGMVAVLAGPGCGKTQLAAEITAPTEERPAGIFLHGRDLNARQRLDDIAKTVVIQGRPVATFEALVAAVDAAGQRARRRLPIVIDGLNEAEDPRLWKSHLKSFSVTLANYPFVLLICTLRAEFAKESLPENIQRFDIPGFRHTDEAIRNYFNYYMIDWTDAELPMHLLNHPLTMRLFCEITNPKREKLVGVEAMPCSLSALFEKYLEQIADRIAQLSSFHYRYYISDIRSALNTTGLTLWSNNVRSIELDQLRLILNDSQRWEDSIVRRLEGEGVFYRLPGEKPGSTRISINYDALAGHIVADSLLSQHGGRDFGKWLNESPQKKLILGHRSQRHTLADDIFKALVGLVPHRMFRQQFWSFLDGSQKEWAIYETAWLSPEYLDQTTVDLLIEQVKKNPEPSRQDIFHRLLATRAASSHPLDATYFDKVLGEMGVADRDIRWSEWVRQSADMLKTDIQYIEKEWKRNFTREIKDRLRALWFKWILTTTDHSLRDHATRALYWYGMGTPRDLFELTIDSFSVNDPYVPERMLAASYGVSMCLWSDKDAVELRSALPSFANSLVDLMFVPDARYATRHALMKEFSLGIIELAQRISPVCIPIEKSSYLQPPFRHLPTGFPEADLIDISVAKATESAIKMDFGNYTLGRLIPGRGNYDFHNLIYKAVRKQIEHRIIELGYSKDVFHEIDKNIQDTMWHPRHNDENKVDRYGKKYSWIAYFEMYGLRHDNEELADWLNGKRTPDVDIDPTFSDLPQEWSPDLPNLFEKPFDNVSKWIAEGPTPDYTHLLQPKSVDSYKGPWILLEGFIEQHSQEDPRIIFTFLRGLLTKQITTTLLLDNFNEFSYPGNSSIPEPLQDHYCFSGEIPWSSRYAKELRNPDGTAIADIRHAFGDLDTGVSVEVPVCEYSWESHHSSLNQSGGATVLAPALCEQLKIMSARGLWDFSDEAGQLATLYRVSKEEDSANSIKLFYIRKDLLDCYLSKTEQNLVWMLWGEREFDYRHSQNLLERHHELISSSKHIHRFGLKYDAG